MAYQHKEGQGSLFANDKKNDRQPDFKGTIVIRGVTYNLSAWNRTSQKGMSYISIQAEEKMQDAAQGNQQYSYQPNQQPPKPAFPGSEKATGYSNEPAIPQPPVENQNQQIAPDDLSIEEDLPF